MMKYLGQRIRYTVAAVERGTVGKGLQSETGFRAGIGSSLARA